MLDREQCVREIAHRLWEEEGRPSDQDQRHWHAAERIFEAEAGASGHSQAKFAREEGPTPASTVTAKRRTARKGSRRTPAASHPTVTQTH